MATKNIVPRADNEGNLGSTAKRWVSFTGNKVDLELATTQAKFAFDGTSNATITVADDSLTTIATAETGNIVLDAGGGIELNADSGSVSVKDAATTLAVIASESFIPTVEYVRVSGFTSGLANTNVVGPDISQGSTSHIFSDVLFANGAAEQVSNPFKAVQAAQLIAGRAGYIRNLKGYIAGTTDQTVTFRVFKTHPTNNSAAALALTELGADEGKNIAMSTTASGVEISMDFDYNAISGDDLDASTAAFAADDIIIVGLQNSDTTAMTCRFFLTMEVVYTATS